MWNEDPEEDEREEKGGKKKWSIREIGLDKIIIMGLCGVFLLVLSLPSFSGKKPTEPTKTISGSDSITKTEGQADDLEAYVEGLEDRLSGVLKKASGVGDAEVMITVKGSKEKVALKDSPYTKEESSQKDSGKESKTSSFTMEDESVMVEGDGSKEPYIIKETQPQIEGVVVVARNGDQALVQQEIIEAVQALFDVPVHKIKVMKLTDLSK